VISPFFLGAACRANALVFPRSQPGLPKSFVLDLSTDNGEATLDSPAGKALLIEAKRKAMTEEVFVEQSMLKVRTHAQWTTRLTCVLQAPDSFDRLMELVEGKAPASLFRLVNVDQVRREQRWLAFC
jgi:hypothetical protein